MCFQLLLFGPSFLDGIKLLMIFFVHGLSVLLFIHATNLNSRKIETTFLLPFSFSINLDDKNKMSADKINVNCMYRYVVRVQGTVLVSFCNIYQLIYVGTLCMYVCLSSTYFVPSISVLYFHLTRRI